MNTDKIVLISIGSFLLSILLCFCKIYFKKKRENHEKMNIKYILKRKDTIKPITDIEENIDKDLNIRNADPTDIP